MSIAQVSGARPAAPQRLRTDQDRRAHVPVHVVWEITLACNLKCGHCGSRAGKRHLLQGKSAKRRRSLRGGGHLVHKTDMKRVLESMPFSHRG